MKTELNPRSAFTLMELPVLLLLLTLPVALQAQFDYTSNNGDITITRYDCSGSGGSVTIPSSINGLPVTSIGDDAFYECASLTGVTIPGSVTHLGRWAFSGCTALLAITVDEANSSFSSLAGVLFNKSQTTLLAYPGGKAGSYVIPDSVTSIGDGTFYLCRGLTSVTMLNGVTNIGRYAFSTYSGTNVTIPDSVTSIGDKAFYECSYLTGVTIPDSVISIGDQAFGGCESLTAITVEAQNPAYSSLNGVLFSKGQTHLLQFPMSVGGNYVIPDSVTSVGSWAFADCTLTNVTIPGSVTNIGDYAFITD